MIKTTVDYHSANKTLSELKDELREKQELLQETGYDFELSRSIESTKKQLRQIESELAQYKSVHNVEVPPTIVPMWYADASMMDLSYALFLAREAKGITRMEMAERLDKSPGLISRWEGSDKTDALKGGKERDIRFKTLTDWGDACGYGIDSYFVEKTSDCLKSRLIPVLSQRLAAIAAQYSTFAKEAYRSAAEEILRFCGGDVITCYLPTRESNFLDLITFAGVQFPGEMAGVIRSSNVPLKILKTNAGKFGSVVSDVNDEPGFANSWFVQRESIKSVLYVVFDCEDANGILFISYRKPMLFDEQCNEIVRQLSLQMSLFATLVKYKPLVHHSVCQVQASGTLEHLRQAMVATITPTIFESSPLSLAEAEKLSPIKTELCIANIQNGSMELESKTSGLETDTVSEKSLHEVTRLLLERRLRSNKSTLVLTEEEIPPAIKTLIQEWPFAVKSIYVGLGPWNEEDRVAIGFNSDVWEECYSTVYRDLLYLHAGQVANNLFKIERRADRSPHTKEGLAQIFASILRKEAFSSASQLPKGICECVNKLLGADATDIWQIEGGEPVHCLSSAYSKHWLEHVETMGFDIDDVRKKLQPRLGGITRQIANDYSRKIFIIQNANDDSQSGKGTRELKLKTVVGIPICDSSSVTADAVLWIRFASNVGKTLCEKDSTNVLTKKWNQVLRSIGDFIHLLLFSSRYDRVIANASTTGTCVPQ